MIAAEKEKAPWGLGAGKAAKTASMILERGKDSKKSALSRLKELYLVEHYKKFPNFPDYAKTTPPYSERTASGLTRMINDWLNLSGHQSERVNVMGRPIDRRRIVTDCIGRKRQIGSLQWIPSGSQRGSADIHATINGKSVKIEVKTTDKQSVHQRKYQQQIENAGGIYLIVRSFVEFLHWYDEYVIMYDNG